MPVINCLRKEVVSGPKTYPLFVGFAPASVILDLASAPSFTTTTPHSDICTNILTPPVREWQRPLDTNRVSAISSVYNDTGELMPNPVLLCGNMLQSGTAISIRQQTGTGGVPTNIWEIQIATPAPGGQKPLWILDGQHRINGLAASAQSGNEIPIVLLLNQAQAIYQGPLVAKLFAQVTTAATPLDELHNEWLTFAFELKSYDSTVSGATEHRKAMQTVAELCRRPLILGNTVGNPFHNKVRFNFHDNTPHGPHAGGFRYNCKDLKDLVWKRYYQSSAPYGQHLSAIDLADQMALAFEALSASVQEPHLQTVFFGDTKHEQGIMQDAFWVGVFAALLKSGPKPDWRPLLNALSFPVTSWNFDWTVSLNGTAGTISKKLAFDVFAKAFAMGCLPTATGNLSDFLKGNNAEIEMQFSILGATGRPTKPGRSSLKVVAGNHLSQNISPATHFRIIRKSENIGKLEIIDRQHPPGNPVYYSLQGEVLRVPQYLNPLKLLLKMHHYGGTQSSANLDINW